MNSPKGIIAIIILVIIATLGFKSYTTVSPGTNKVATLFGKVQSEPLGEGFHIVNPLLDFVSFDLKLQEITYPNIQVPSQDKLKTSMDVTVRWTVTPGRTPEVLQRIGNLDRVLDNLITPKVRSLMRETGKSVAQSQDFFQDSTQQIMQEFLTSTLTDDLIKEGVVVKDVLIRDITLPQVVTSAVIQTKERQEQLEREKAQLMIVEQQAQQQVKEAEAREQAAIADANAKRTIADASAYEIEKIAESQAKANKLLSESITDELIRYNGIQRWSGEYPRTLLSGEGGQGVLLSLPAN